MEIYDPVETQHFIQTQYSTKPGDNACYSNKDQCGMFDDTNLKT